MSKILIGLAAAGVTAMLALPAPAIAKDRPADGVRNVEQMEFSAGRRVRRHVWRHHGPRRVYHRHWHARSWYRPYRHAYWPRYRSWPYYASYSYPYYAPYYAYAYSPYYYRPGPFFSIGPFGFSFGFGY
jgi:hypothetical protein